MVLGPSRLHLYSFAYNHSSSLNSFALSSNERAEISAKATLEITDLLNLARRHFNQSKFWPAFVKNCVVYTTSLGLAISQMVEPIQANQLIEACHIANGLIQSWSIFSKDNYSRYASHIGNFIKNAGRELGTEAIQHHPTESIRVFDNSAVRSRMSANILYNVIWHGKRIAEKVRHNNADDAQMSLGATTQQDHSTLLGGSGYLEMYAPFSIISDRRTAF